MQILPPTPFSRLLRHAVGYGGSILDSPIHKAHTHCFIQISKKFSDYDLKYLSPLERVFDREGRVEGMGRMEGWGA